LLPHLTGVVIESVEASDGMVVLCCRSAAGGALCPGCGCFSARVHGRYQRVLVDSGLAGRGV